MSFAFTLVVMYDAIGVRNHVTKLNKIIKSLVPKESAKGNNNNAVAGGNHPLLQCLDDTIGHTPTEIMYGGIFGVTMTFLLKTTLTKLL